MNNQAGSQQAQTVANALSGEKSFETVRFAITGNPTADAVSGIMAVLNTIKLGSVHNPHSRHAAFLLEYLARSFGAEADKAEEHERAARQPNFPSGVGTLPLGGIGSTPPPPWAYSGTSAETMNRLRDEMIGGASSDKPKQVHPDAIPGWLPND